MANPAEGKFTVQIETSLQAQRSNLSVFMYNSTGQKADCFVVSHLGVGAFPRNDDKFEIDASTLPKGMYYVILKNDQQIIGSAKVLIQR